MWITDVYLGENVVQGPDMLFRSPTMHHYDERAFAAKEVDEKLEKRVDGECLIHVTYWIEELGRCE